MAVKRFLVITIGLSFVALALAIIRQGLVGSDHFGFTRDIEPGLMYLKTITEAEERCYGNLQHYVRIDELSDKGCGGLDPATLSQPHSGFFLEGSGQDREYWIRLSPALQKPSREISLYTDQTGLIRWTTGRRLATSSSEVLSSNRTKSLTPR
jgi:hypothetical protein